MSLEGGIGEDVTPRDIGTAKTIRRDIVRTEKFFIYDIGTLVSFATCTRGKDKGYKSRCETFINDSVHNLNLDNK